MFIEVRCKDCKHKLCEISHDLLGVVKVWCRYCKRDQVVSPSVVLKESEVVKSAP